MHPGALLHQETIYRIASGGIKINKEKRYIRGVEIVTYGCFPDEAMNFEFYKF